MSGAPEAPPGVPAAPLLTESVIREELDRVLPRHHRSSLVAFFGSGPAGRVQAHARQFEIIPTRSELELRSHLPELAGQEEREGKVFLVDWTDRLPLDIACRLASGRLRRISRDSHLAALFGARDADPRLMGTALAGLLLTDAELGRRLKKVSGQVLQYADAYARFLHALVDFPLEPELPAGAFLEWCVRNERGGAVVERIRAEAAGRLGAELEVFIAGRFGALGGAAWAAWMAGQGALFGQYALLVHALAGQWGAGTYAEGALEAKLGAPGLVFGRLLVDARGELTDALVRDVLGRLGWREAERRRAELLLDQPRLQEALAGSRFLPRGLEARREAFAAALRAVATSPSPEGLAVARVARERIREHELGDPAEEARDMGLRLAAFLVEGTGEPPPAPAAPAYQRALELAGWYARDGGFVDWARRVLRPIREGPCLEAFQLLLARVDERRAELDRAFAEGLAAWYRHDLPAAQGVPIADASRRLVADFLQGNGQRKCLVVLMDGMAQADAVSLLRSLEGVGDRWLPVSWQPRGYTLPAGLLPPVIAAMPSLTSVSRAAFFAGRLARADAERPTSDDPKRWAQNRHLAPFFAEGAAPKLLLKDEVFSGGGLSQRAIELIGGEDRVVAVVVNAIDDQLKGGQQVSLQYSVDHIPTLRSLLSYAAHNERAVLLIADHGHVVGERLESRGPRHEPGGARWRALKAGEAPAPFEVELASPSVWMPGGFERVAAVWDDRAVYGTPGAGEHGGISLAEAICPAVLLAPESLADALAGAPDEGLRTVRRYEPGWWRFEAEVRQVPAPVPAQAPAPRPAQEELFHPPPVAPRSAPPAPVAVAPHPLAERLARSPIFKARAEGRPAARVDAALRHLSLLLEAGDRMPPGELARRTGLPAFRASGPILDLQELLNVEGYQVVVFDRSGEQVSVNRPMLVQTFELEEGR